MRPKIDLKAMAARELRREEQLREAAELRKAGRLCGSREWVHCVWIVPYECTVRLEVFRRTTAGMDFEYHEVSGTTWTYSTESDLADIKVEIDRIGLAIGSLVVYER